MEKSYLCNWHIDFGDKVEYQVGDTIKLSDKDAEPLLEVGAVAKPEKTVEKDK